MAKLVLGKLLFAGIAIISSTAIAGSLVGPTYIGDRSKNPEKETYGYLIKSESARPLAFVGPARYFGPVTGDAEKDTIAYRPLLGEQRNGLWAFWLERSPCEIAFMSKVRIGCRSRDSRIRSVFSAAFRCWFLWLVRERCERYGSLRSDTA